MPFLTSSRRSSCRARANAARIVAAFFSVSLAAGCQTMGPGASLTGDASDPCSRERSEFAGSKTYFQDKLVTSAALGAAGGAALGALGAVMSGGRDARSILTGAAIGGVVGGVAGAGSAYYNSLAERARDQEEVANYMNQDLATETDRIDRTTATFARLRTCRFSQARFIKDQFRSKAVDRTTGLARIAYHRDKFNEEIGIARQFGVSMANRNQQFQEAANALRTPPARQQVATGPMGGPTGGPARPVAARPASPQRVATVYRAASVSVPEKRAGFDRTVAAAERTSKPAFDIDSNASLSWSPLNWFHA